MSTENTLDQITDAKNIFVTGSDILMNAETRDVSKKLKTSFSNALQDDSLDITPAGELSHFEPGTFDQVQKLKKLATKKESAAAGDRQNADINKDGKRMKAQVPSLKMT
jgi:hypothetical protein